MMRFTKRPRINWGPLPSPRRRRNWCGLCRRPSGPLFDMPDDVWLHYVGEDQRHQILCIGCWHWLTDAIDGSAYERENGRAVPLWSTEFRRRHGIPPDEPSPWDGTTEAEASP
jgi:hypothetical protein